MGEGLTLLFPISFDPVKCVDLILQMPLRKLSRGCILGNAHTSKLKETAPPETRPLPLAETNAEPKPFTWTARQNHRRRQTKGTKR